MVATGTSETSEIKAGTDSTYDKQAELKAFDDSKAGVRGLVEAGVTKVPRMFYRENSSHNEPTAATHLKFSIPIIDLEGIHGDSVQKSYAVNRIRTACEKWGTFQLINHGIQTHVLDEMINGVRRFHEQDRDARKQFYTRDFSRKVAYFSNSNLYRDPYAKWIDTVLCFMAPHPPKPEELPALFREIVMEYSEKTMALGITLLDYYLGLLDLNRFTLKKWILLRITSFTVTTIPLALNQN